MSPAPLRLSFTRTAESTSATGGHEVSMTPGVESVLQNVVLLVDHGQLAPSATYTDNAIWGYTLGGGYVVPRSGIGVTADGALVYVAGPALTAKSLAESLQRAGAVRAMTLDINPEWVTFNFYAHPSGPSGAGHGDQALPADAAARRPLPPARVGGARLLRSAVTRAVGRWVGNSGPSLLAPTAIEVRV